MRLLYVVRHVPHVPAPGGLTRTYHLVCAAAAIAQVTLLATEYDPATDELEQMRALCEDIHFVPPPSHLRPRPRLRRRSLARGLGVVQALTRPDPYAKIPTNRAALRAMVRESLQSGRYDMMVAEYTDLAMLLCDEVTAWGGPAVANLYDLDSMLQRRTQRLRREESGRRRPSLSGWQLVRRLEGIERDILRSYTGVTAVSRQDAALLRRLASRATVGLVPNGVDTEYFGAVASWPPVGLPPGAGGEIVLFTGTLYHNPNKDGLRYFMADVLPSIRARRPQARLWIVGAAPVPEMLRPDALPEGVEVFTSVDDVRPYLAAAAVTVVPLRLSSGTRLKILEALAAHRPVVSTSLGAEGLDLEPGRDYARADTPTAFAEAVLAVLEDPARAREMADRGRETVRRRYSWRDSIAPAFQGALHAARAAKGRGDSCR